MYKVHYLYKKLGKTFQHFMALLKEGFHRTLVWAFILISRIQGRP